MVTLVCAHGFFVTTFHTPHISSLILNPHSPRDLQTSGIAHANSVVVSTWAASWLRGFVRSSFDVYLIIPAVTIVFWWLLYSWVMCCFCVWYNFCSCECRWWVLAFWVLQIPFSTIEITHASLMVASKHLSCVKICRQFFANMFCLSLFREEVSWEGKLASLKSSECGDLSLLGVSVSPVFLNLPNASAV